MPTFVDGPTVTLHAFAVAHAWLTPVVIGVTAAFIFLCPIWFVVMRFTPLYPHPPNNSFPSTLTAFAAVAGVIALLAWRRRGLVLVLGTGVVAVGCVYVGVHYVSDVIVGAALGAVCGTVMWMVVGLPPVTRALSVVERRIPGRRRTHGAAAADARPREVPEVATAAS